MGRGSQGSCIQPIKHRIGSSTKTYLHHPAENVTGNEVKKPGISTRYGFSQLGELEKTKFKVLKV